MVWPRICKCLLPYTWRWACRNTVSPSCVRGMPCAAGDQTEHCQSVVCPWDALRCRWSHCQSVVCPWDALRCRWSGWRSASSTWNCRRTASTITCRSSTATTISRRPLESTAVRECRRNSFSLPGPRYSSLSSRTRRTVATASSSTGKP